MATDDRLTGGLHAVRAALALRRVRELWLDNNRRDGRVQGVLALAKEAGVACHSVERRTLEQLLPGTRHQGVVARCLSAAPLEEEDLSPLLASIEGPPLLLVLDGVQDPHNLGACLRTADGAGVHAVIAPRDRAAGVNPTVRKVASGAAETVPFVQVTNLARTLRELKNAGIWLVGTEGEASQSLYQVDLKGPTALIMGAEGGGLRRLTADLCDYRVHIPLLGTVASLNVSVATGVCLYEALRQRGSY